MKLLGRAATTLALAAIAGCSDEPTGLGAELITSPAMVTQLTGGADSQRFYRIVVPAGATQLSQLTRARRHASTVFSTLRRAPYERSAPATIDDIAATSLRKAS